VTAGKARVGRAHKTRADLEHELKACRRELARARERLAEAAMQQTATSEMLRLISNSPIQSMLDAVAEQAARLCDARNARIWRLDDNRLRLVATYGESSATMDGREGLPVARDTVTGRAACDRRTIHVHDISAEVDEFPLGSRIVQGEGWRTTLATPLLREGTPIGTILVRRMEIRPFQDKQIALLETFAGQAAIAIENVRLFEAETQRTLALARANRDLAEREAKIRRLVDSNIIGIFITGLKGRVLEANDAFLRLVGHDREDLVSGRIRWTDLTPPEWRERDNRGLAELGSNTIAQPYEKEFFRKDGSRVPVLIGGALFEEGGDEGVAFVLDLTERKRAEEALREREAKIQRLVDSNIIGIFVWDFDGRILEANDDFLRMVGYDREDLLAGDIWWTDLTPPDWRDRNNARIAQQKGSGRFEPFEKEFTRKDGSRVPILIGGATFEKGGNEGVAYVLDLTERKRLEERQRVQHTIAQILAEAATIEEATPRILRAMGECLGWDLGVLWRVDRGAEALRCVELWHKASIDVPEFERVSRERTFVPGLGLPGRVWSSLKPEYVPDVVPDENFPRAPIAEREGLHTAFGFPILLGGEVLGVIEFFSREIRQPDQELLDMLATIGSQIGQFIERKRVEAEAHESEQRYRTAQLELAHANRVATMGQLTSSIAHEVNQPITAAVTYALAARRWLSAEPPNFREADDALSLIVKEGNRASEVVGRIRALIKKVPARKDAVAINDAILEVIALTRTEAANNSVSVRTQLAEGSPSVQGDRVQLQQVLLNLMINAIEAMRDVGEEERELIVSTRNEPDGVSVEVRDSGPGFTPAASDRVFEAFYTTKPGGLGLGLSICRSIIEAHNGRLWASPNVPRGAIFRFIAPAHPDAAS
jgi:PAS domain S-box-containing protein